MAPVLLAYELLAEIFKICVSFHDTLPETLLQVCRLWNAVASQTSILWTKFVISGSMIRWNSESNIMDEGEDESDEEEDESDEEEDPSLTHDWVGIFKRRLARAGPSHPLHISILSLHKLLLPVIDVVAGGAPKYVLLPRWETFNLRTSELIREIDDPLPSTWPDIAMLISQPMPALRYLTLQQNKIDFHAFPNAPNLQELNILYSRSPLIGQKDSFPNLKTVHITYPGKYPLSLVRLKNFSLQTIETLIIGGEVEFGRNVEGTYPSLSTLELTERVSRGIAYMSAPNLRHLILRNKNLFCGDNDDQNVLPQSKNRQALEMLAITFPTVEVLEVHKNLRNIVSKMISDGEAWCFKGLKELRTVSKEERRRWGWLHRVDGFGGTHLKAIDSS
jgi:hypothetical protein